jgi:hypothetical protein
MVNNWQEYTGKYVVVPEGFDYPLNDEAVSMSKAFEIAKPYFKK